MKSSAIANGDNADKDQYNYLRLDAQAASYLLGHEKNTPDMGITVEAGIAFIGSSLVNYAGGNSSSLVNPVSNPRIDLLVIDSAGTLAWVAGTEAASPVIPTIPTNKLAICAVYLRTTGTTIRDTDQGSGHYIYRDMRSFLASAPAATTTKTAGYNVTAGDKVGIGRSGKVGKANYLDTGTVGQVSLPSTATNASFSLAYIGNYKFAICYNTATNTVKAAILTYNPATQTSSFGAEVTMSTDVGSYNEWSVAQLDTDKFAFIFIGNTLDTKVYSIVGSVSGTTITPSGSTVLYTHASSLFAFTNIIRMATDKIAVYICRNAATAYGGIFAVTYSGTTPTAGTPGALNTTYFNQNGKMALIATDKIALTVEGTPALQIVTFSGTVATVGTAVALTISGTYSDTNQQIVKFATDAFVVASSTHCKAVTVSGTVPTVGSELAHGASGAFLRLNEATGKMEVHGSTITKELAISGTTISASNTIIGDNGIAISNIRTYLVNVSSTEWYLFSSNTTYIRIMSADHAIGFTGIAQSTVSAGADCPVLYQGVDSNQTGLVAGTFYYPDDDGTLTPAGATLATSTIAHFLLRAISATEIII